ncbi:hypothetical protein ABPG74_009156 [Tetrahymena malaccensis]
MNKTNNLTYSLNKNEILRQIEQNSNTNFKYLVFLAENSIQQINSQDIQNIIQLLSQYKSLQIIFEGLDNDISIFMMKEIENFFLTSQFKSSISFFAKSNQKLSFQIEILTSSIHDIIIQYYGFFLHKEKNKLKIRVCELDSFENYLSLLNALSNNDEINIQLTIVNHSNVCGQKKIEIFNILYSMLQKQQNFSIEIRNYIKYLNYSKFISIDYKYWDSDLLDEQILSRYPFSNLKKLFKFSNINFQSSHFSIILNEEEFKLELKLDDLNQLIDTLDIIQEQQNQQLCRLKIQSTNFIYLSNQDILQLKKYNFCQLKVPFSVEISQNKLLIEQLQDLSIFDSLLYSFFNLQILSVNSRNYNFYKDILKNLPSTLQYIKILYCDNIILFLDKENLIAKDVVLNQLNQFKTLISTNKLKNIVIEIQCQNISRQWFELITQQDQLIKLNINLFHLPCCYNSYCKNESNLELAKIYGNEAYLLSIQENIRMPQMYYTRNDKLIVLQLSFKIRNSLMTKLDYKCLDIQIYNIQELLAIIQYIQSRKQLNLPIIHKLSLLLFEEFEAEGLQKALSQLYESVKQIFIYVQKRCILVFDFENKFYYNKINFNPFNTEQNLTYFDVIQYESSNRTSLQNIQQMLKPQKINQSVYLTLNLNYEEAVQFFQQLKNSQLILFCDLQINNLKKKEQVNQILEFLAIQIQNGQIKSLKLGLQSLCIVYSDNNIQFTSYQYSSYKFDLNQELYLEHFLSNLKIYINKLIIILDSRSYQENNVINQLQNIFSYSNVKKVFLGKNSYEQISNSRVKTLQSYQYHKNILMLFLPKLVKIGLDRYEKIEQYLSFFTFKQNFILSNYSSIKYNNNLISKFVRYSDTYYASF